MRNDLQLAQLDKLNLAIQSLLTEQGNSVWQSALTQMLGERNQLLRQLADAKEMREDARRPFWQSQYVLHQSWLTQIEEYRNQLAEELGQLRRAGKGAKVYQQTAHSK